MRAREARNKTPDAEVKPGARLKGAMVVNCAGVGDGGVLFPYLRKTPYITQKTASCMTEAEASGFMRPEMHNQAGQWEMYQEQCTRNADCRVYRFLERQASLA